MVADCCANCWKLISTSLLVRLPTFCGMYWRDFFDIFYCFGFSAGQLKIWNCWRLLMWWLLTRCVNALGTRVPFSLYWNKELIAISFCWQLWTFDQLSAVQKPTAQFPDSSTETRIWGCIAKICTCINYQHLWDGSFSPGNCSWPPFVVSDCNNWEA